MRHDLSAISVRAAVQKEQAEKQAEKAEKQAKAQAEAQKVEQGIQSFASRGFSREQAYLLYQKGINPDLAARIRNAAGDPDTAFKLIQRPGVANLSPMELKLAAAIERGQKVEFRAHQSEGMGSYSRYEVRLNGSLLPITGREAPRIAANLMGVFDIIIPMGREQFITINNGRVSAESISKTLWALRTPEEVKLAYQQGEKKAASDAGLTKQGDVYQGAFGMSFKPEVKGGSVGFVETKESQTQRETAINLFNFASRMNFLGSMVRAKLSTDTGANKRYGVSVASGATVGSMPGSLPKATYETKWFDTEAEATIFQMSDVQKSARLATIESPIKGIRDYYTKPRTAESYSIQAPGIEETFPIAFGREVAFSKGDKAALEDISKGETKVKESFPIGILGSGVKFVGDIGRSVYSGAQAESGRAQVVIDANPAWSNIPQMAIRQTGILRQITAGVSQAFIAYPLMLPEFAVNAAITTGAGIGTALKTGSVAPVVSLGKTSIIYGAAMVGEVVSIVQTRPAQAGGMVIGAFALPAAIGKVYPQYIKENPNSQLAQLNKKLGSPIKTEATPPSAKQIEKLQKNPAEVAKIKAAVRKYGDEIMEWRSKARFDEKIAKNPPKAPIVKTSIGDVEATAPILESIKRRAQGGAKPYSNPAIDFGKSGSEIAEQEAKMRGMTNPLPSNARLIKSMVSEQGQTISIYKSGRQIRASIAEPRQGIWTMKEPPSAPTFNVLDIMGKRSGATLERAPLTEIPEYVKPSAVSEALSWRQGGWQGALTTEGIPVGRFQLQAQLQASHVLSRGFTMQYSAASLLGSMNMNLRQQTQTQIQTQTQTQMQVQNQLQIQTQLLGRIQGQPQLHAQVQAQITPQITQQIQPQVQAQIHIRPQLQAQVQIQPQITIQNQIQRILQPQKQLLPDIRVAPVSFKAPMPKKTKKVKGEKHWFEDITGQLIGKGEKREKTGILPRFFGKV